MVGAFGIPTVAAVGILFVFVRRNSSSDFQTTKNVDWELGVNFMVKGVSQISTLLTSPTIFVALIVATKIVGAISRPSTGRSTAFVPWVVSSDTPFPLTPLYGPSVALWRGFISFAVGIVAILDNQQISEFPLEILQILLL